MPHRSSASIRPARLSSRHGLDEVACVSLMIEGLCSSRAGRYGALTASTEVQTSSAAIEAASGGGADPEGRSQKHAVLASRTSPGCRGVDQCRSLPWCVANWCHLEHWPCWHQALPGWQQAWPHVVPLGPAFVSGGKPSCQATGAGWRRQELGSILSCTPIRERLSACCNRSCHRWAGIAGAVGASALVLPPPVGGEKVLRRPSGVGKETANWVNTDNSS